MHDLLFIEDDEHIRLALRLALEDEGYTVREAATGREGLEAFHAREPELVLLDLRLPDISGFDVCRTIRSNSIVPIPRSATMSPASATPAPTDRAASAITGITAPWPTANTNVGA